MTATDPQPTNGASSGQAGERPASRLGRDFGTRLVSGLVLAAGALGLTYAGTVPFGLLVLVVTLIVSWEWGSIVRKAGADTIFVLHAGAVFVAVVLSLAGLPALGIVAVIVGAILAALLGFERLGRISGLGVLYAGLPAIALIWIRASVPFGFEAALFLLLCIWASDTGAYLAGRTIGGPKLMPAVSPNKTWSGLIGGTFASLLVALAFGLSMANLPIGRLLATAAILAVISQAGDLMESALKRWHGVKDASGLIPGHGGFMDRVDGLIFAAIAAAMFAAAVNVYHPAQAILTWQ